MTPTSVPEFHVEKKRRNPFLLFGALGAVFVGAVALALFMSSSLSWMSFEKYNSDEYFQQIVEGKREERRMAALQWAQDLAQLDSLHKVIPKGLRPRSDQTATLGKLLIGEQSSSDDFLFVSALASLLAFSDDPTTARQSLGKFLESSRGQTSTQAQLFALAALGKQGCLTLDECREVIKRANHPDESIRKTVAFALQGFRGDPNLVHPTLLALLGDSELDVRQNAALSLTKLDFKEGYPLIQKILEEAQATLPNQMTLEKFELFSQTLRVLKQKNVAEFKDSIAKIAASHPHLKLREVAKESL